jgi:hypothetical protein
MEEQPIVLHTEQGEDHINDNIETKRMGPNEKDASIRNHHTQHNISVGVAQPEEEREQIKPTTLRTGVLWNQRKDSETDSIAQQRHSAFHDTIRDDKDFEEMDTELSQSNKEGTREEVRPSPIIPKKMKV